MNLQDTSTNVDNTPVTVESYHQRSKHSLNKYAQGPDGLDWDTQPDPYRRFANCPKIALPLNAKSLDVDFNDLYKEQRIEPVKISQQSIGVFFELSLGLSAWKVFGTDRWALRVNPSSGNLHPTEAYMLFSGTGIVPAGVYHYLSHEHCLEQRCNLKSGIDALTAALGTNRFIIGLSSIHWREAWKYGERAFRYCQHDVGHAVAALRYAAATLGWKLKLLDTASDQQIAQLLGLNREQDFDNAEHEAPDVLLEITTTDVACELDIEKILSLVENAEWKGQANTLSPDNRIRWNIIDEISLACEKPETEVSAWTPAEYPAMIQCDSTQDASKIIRQRRSAQSFDGKTEISLTQFYRMLDSLLPRKNTAPFDAINWQPRIHLVIFVHRVEGLKPGLYVFPRSESGEILLRENLRDSFDWTYPPIRPGSLPLYHLVSANSQNASRTTSCHQSIASDGAFCVSMLAEFEATVEKPWQYRQLFWEAGMIGQSLYLEAEAVDLRGTGIGCFFDDAVHEILGIKNNRLQVIYHFTVGKQMLDTRLISLPPYGHLQPEGK